MPDRSAVDSSVEAQRSVGLGGAVSAGANRAWMGSDVAGTASASRTLAVAVRWLWQRLARRSH
jgi:hypothetical protein